MLFQFHDGDVLVDVRLGRRHVLSNQDEIDAFRKRVHPIEDLTTSIPRFVVRTALAGGLPVIFLMRRSGSLFGVVLFHLRNKFGIPSGVLSSGDETGQGCAIAEQGHKLSVLEIAARVLTKIPFVHTGIITTIWEELEANAHQHAVPGTTGRWQFREVGFRLDLGGGPEQAKMRLGYKMRRNLGYYRRRAETKLGCRFWPDMQPQQRLAAVNSLSDQGSYPSDIKLARQLDIALSTIPGNFAMGLQSGEGDWLSYIAGWRAQNGTYIEWQLNRENPADASFATVIRSYFIDHELALPSPAIIFVGGTTPQWTRACKPMVCADLLVFRSGMIGSLSRRIGRLVSPNGRFAELEGKSAY